MAHWARTGATPSPVTGLKHRSEEKLYESANPYIFTIGRVSETTPPGGNSVMGEGYGLRAVSNQGALQHLQAAL